MTNTRRIRGRIRRVGSPNPSHYIIEDENDPSVTYLAHIGDLQENENLLYQLAQGQSGTVAQFQDGELVEFDIQPEHAIHVRRVPDGESR